MNVPSQDRRPKSKKRVPPGAERTRANRRWTKKEEAELAREVRAGKVLEQIALDHGRTEAAIEARAGKLVLGSIRRQHGRASGSPSAIEDSATQPRLSGLRRLFKRG